MPVKKRRGRLGQVVVEMLLILPVFLTIVFSIMELGNIAFWVIVLNHATFECARIGGMLYADMGSNVNGPMQNVMGRFITGATVTSSTEQTIQDPQASQMNQDLVVTGTFNVPLVFPISSIILANPAGTGKRQIEAVVRMPVEQPLSQ